jgi:hypothetical protein
MKVGVVLIVVVALMVCCFTWLTNVVGRGADAHQCQALLFYAKLISIPWRLNSPSAPPIDFINSMTITFPLISKILSYSLRNELFYNARTTFLDVVFRILDGLSRRHNSKRPSARTTRPFTSKNRSTSQHYSTASIACRKKISMRLSSLFSRLSLKSSH